MYIYLCVCVKERHTFYSIMSLWLGEWAKKSWRKMLKVCMCVWRIKLHLQSNLVKSYTQVVVENAQIQKVTSEQEEEEEICLIYY